MYRISRLRCLHWTQQDICKDLLRCKKKADGRYISRIVGRIIRWLFDYILVGAIGLTRGNIQHATRAPWPRLSLRSSQIPERERKCPVPQPRSKLDRYISPSSRWYRTWTKHPAPFGSYTTRHEVSWLDSVGGLLPSHHRAARPSSTGFSWPSRQKESTGLNGERNQILPSGNIFWAKSPLISFQRNNFDKSCFQNLWTAEAVNVPNSDFIIEERTMLRPQDSSFLGRVF